MIVIFFHIKNYILICAVVFFFKDVQLTFLYGAATGAFLKSTFFCKYDIF